MNAVQTSRCRQQLRAQSTENLKEMAGMMERSNRTEMETLSLILEELESRGVSLEGVEWGIVRADASPE